MSRSNLRRRSPKLPAATANAKINGGCACGGVRYEVTLPPLFVHCCHCTRCQRESGTAFVTHAMIERRCLRWSGAVLASRLPTDSRSRHEIVHCAACLTPLWGQHGRQPSVIVYIKVGTLDLPERFPAQAHIFVRSKLPWLALDDAVPQFLGEYNASKLWPAESQARYAAARHPPTPR
jgi:hypothetical protein